MKSQILMIEMAHDKSEHRQTVRGSLCHLPMREYDIYSSADHRNYLNIGHLKEGN